MGASQRRKGHSFERETAAQLRVVFPDARRLLEYHQADAKGVDVQNTDEFRFQCKRTRKYVSINTIKEVQCERWLGEIPVLVAQADGEEAMAVIPWEDLIRLIKAAKASR